jgi:hypothetical protein
MEWVKRSINDRIALIAKKPRTAVYTLVAVMLIAVIAVGCTFTGAKDVEGDTLPLTDVKNQAGENVPFAVEKDAETENIPLSGEEVAGISIGVEVEENVPQAVLDYAVDYVAQQVDFYNEIGKELSGNRKYTITDAKITGLTSMNTGTASNYYWIGMWLLEYRLLPDNPENILLAGGMRMEEKDGKNWITEWGSTGQPYLLMLCIETETEIWHRLCVTNTDTIKHDYGTKEMLESYGNEFTAASMELFRKNTIQTIGQVPDIYSQEEDRQTEVCTIAELLMTRLLDDMKTYQNGRTFIIKDWKNLSVSVEPADDIWSVAGSVDLRFDGILWPRVSVGSIPEDEKDEYVTVSLGERYLKYERAYIRLL